MIQKGREATRRRAQNGRFHRQYRRGDRGKFNFRHVLYTGKHLQLVMMTISPGEDIGEEVHEGGDQFFRIERGHGIVTIDGRESEITDGDGVVVPAGARHNIKNVGEDPLRLYTLYAPPDHRDGYVASTRADAQKSHEEFDGKTTE